MRKQAGQAFILVLILLGIGALLVVPALRLTGTSLTSSQIVERQVKGLYAADAATEYILWKLAYDNLGAQFTVDGQSASFNFNVCEVPVGVTVVMRATEGTGGIILSGDDVIRPTKTVEPNAHEAGYQTYTYTINLKQVSIDTSQGLDAIYDILPRGFDAEDYHENSSYLRVDGGSWEPIGDPLVEDVDQIRLRWPNPDTYGSENFTDTDPIRDFEPGQEKELKFQISGTLANNKLHHNWVVLKPWNTLSGSQASITVGSPDETFGEFGMMEFTKTSNPEIIQPGVETAIEYTINITNTFDQRHEIFEIRDYLPSGFSYTGPVSGLTTLDPQRSLEDLNGVERWVLRWTEEEFPDGDTVYVDPGETLSLTFAALTTKDVSGSYYNEFTVYTDEDVPDVFSEIGVTDEDFRNNFSWNLGAVIVPAYDTSSDSEGTTIDANMALVLGGITITSWQVD